MKSSSKSKIFEKMLSDYIKGDNDVRQHILNFLNEHVFRHKFRHKNWDNDTTDKGLQLLIPDILRIFCSSDSNRPVSKTINFEIYLPSGSPLSPYLEEISPFVIKHEKEKDCKWFLGTRKYPMLIVGWFGKPTSEKKPKLALIYFVRGDQQRIGDIVSIERKGRLLYKSNHVPADFIGRTIRDKRNEIKETYKITSQKWKEIRKSPQKNGELKECENCGRDFIAYRTDARSCSLSACKKALSRKNKIRDYQKKDTLS